MTLSSFRIHPTIGFARVGDGEEYYLAPETIVGMPVPGRPGLIGGLPIKAGSEDEPITARDLRDRDGRLKRQAARFRIFAYTPEQAVAYPSGAGTEITIGSVIDGKVVVDIIWTVHVANKKGNCFVLDIPGYDGSIIERYADGRTPPLRNAKNEVEQTQLVVDVPNINDPDRIQRWTTDPGPRTLRGPNGQTAFDRGSAAGAAGKPLPNYPKLFPAADETQVFAPRGVIDTLGQIETDATGRLIFVGGYGRACSFFSSTTLSSAVDNDGWFDDTSDGPVDAVVVLRPFEVRDGRNVASADQPAEYVLASGAWVVTADPGYAPQILNTVSIWDEVYNTWIRELGLQPELYVPEKGYNLEFRPSFPDHIEPFFKAASLQEWTTNIPQMAQKAHRKVGEITAADDPARTIMSKLAFVRDPNAEGQANVGAPLMPLALGDAGMAFLVPTFTQYFFLSQWDRRMFEPKPPHPLGPGELLDKAALTACLGGRFGPGIDLTFTVRQADVYIADWRKVGPFRIARRPLDYARMQPDIPFLTGGYVPRNSGANTVEPGDMTKFMSVPWHTDYNSCATHPTSPSIRNISSLYWSWPAQRPVDVYVASELGQNGELGPHRYSVRGYGTLSANPANQGRYQFSLDMVTNWPRIGVVLQGGVIDTLPDRKIPPDAFLEVEGLLVGEPNPEVAPWPMNQLAVDSA
jgi:hypothetical protein